MSEYSATTLSIPSASPTWGCEAMSASLRNIRQQRFAAQPARDSSCRVAPTPLCRQSGGRLGRVCCGHQCHRGDGSAALQPAPLSPKLLLLAGPVRGAAAPPSSGAAARWRDVERGCHARLRVRADGTSDELMWCLLSALRVRAALQIWLALIARLSSELARLPAQLTTWPCVRLARPQHPRTNTKHEHAYWGVGGRSQEHAT